jgi:N-acetylmuramic acid 6-phosphate etherase
VKRPRPRRTASRWAGLLTESRNPRSRALDTLPTPRVVALVLDEDRRALLAAARERAPIARAADLAARVIASGGRIVFLGAGTSGRLGVLEAAECPPTFGVAPELVVAIVAGGAESLAVAQEAAEDDDAAGARDLESAGVSAADAVVLLSASGRTPYVLGAARAAATAGALTVAVVCARDSELGLLVDHEVAAVVGPEVLAGSTRLKAGTAQKLVLNTISTVAMIRLGKTYGNLMVDVVASNAKLRARARRAVGIATGAGEEQVAAALEAAGGEPKVAIVSLLADIDPAEARTRLAAAGGVVRRALES